MKNMKTRRSVVNAKGESEDSPDGIAGNRSAKSLCSKGDETVDIMEMKKPKLLRRSNVGLFDKNNGNSEVSPLKVIEKKDNSNISPIKIVEKKISNISPIKIVEKKISNISPIKVVEKKENSKVDIKQLTSPKKTADLSILDDSKEHDNFTCLEDLCLIDDDYDDFYQEVCSVVTTHPSIDKKKGLTEVKNFGDDVSKLLQQKKRTQNNIVMVTDERINLDLSCFRNGVSNVAIPSLKLSNALESIKTNSNFGKGTIFIIVCGTHDLLMKVPAQECLSSKYCSNVLNILELSPVTSDIQYLVKEANKLSAEILCSTENDIALFCGLVTVDINQENKFLRLNRVCRLAHNIDHLPNADIILQKNYVDAVESFNTYVNKYAEEIGFSPWKKDVFNSCLSNLHRYKLFDNQFAVCQVEQKKIEQEIKTKCNELLQTLSFPSATKPSQEILVQQPPINVPEKLIKVEKSSLNQLEQVESFYHEDLQTIMKRQKNRAQYNIVIVTDDRDNFDVSLVGFDGRVEILKIPGLSFDNAFGFIKSHKNFERGSIFVFLCGIYDLLQPIPLEDCLNLKCKSPLKVFALSPCVEDSNCLIKKALKLSDDILEHSQNNIAIFAGLIPVAINQYNKATFKNRPCVVNHPALPALNIHPTKYNDYNAAIDCYNAFVKYHAKMFSYSSWDLEKSYFTNAKPLSLLLPNGYSLCYDEKMKRLNKVKTLCIELMLDFPSADELCETSIENIDESSGQNVADNFEPCMEVEIEAKPTMEVVIEAKPHREAEMEATPTKEVIIKSKAPIKASHIISSESIKGKICKIYSDDDLNKVKSLYQLNIKKIIEMQKGRKQRSIVIVTDERDNFDVSLAEFDSRVSVMKIQGFKLANALTSIKINRNYGKGTIFIFICGTHDLLHSVPLKECSEVHCKSPQLIMNLSTSYSDSHSLIKKALKLNLNILQSTTDDIALFCGLIPVDIDHYNNHCCLLQRKCFSDHKALEVPNVDSEIYKAYINTVSMFNDFTKYHAQALNLSPWDLEVRCYLRGSPSVNKNLLHNGFNVDSEEENERTLEVKYLCSKLLVSFPVAPEIPYFKIESGSATQAIIKPTIVKEDIKLATVKEEIKSATVKEEIMSATVKDEIKSFINKEEINVLNADSILTSSADKINVKNVKKYSDSFLERISSVYHADMQKIIKLQMDRSPQKIVIYTDDRDHLDVNLAGFNKKVEVIKLPGMKLATVFSALKTHSKFGKGTIFIFIMGTHDLLQSVSLIDCLDFQCPFPQTMLTLLPASSDKHYLIKSALQLNLDILLTTANDVALFCGVIPVRINIYNQFTVANRKCCLLHPAYHVPNVDLLNYGNYRKNVLNYNNFTKYHAQTLGFEPWDLETPYFERPKRNILLPNMYNLHPDEEMKRASRVKAICTGLLRNSSSVLTTASINEELKIHGAENKMQIEDSKDIISAAAINVPPRILKTMKQHYQDNIDKIVKLQKGRQPNNIVIVTDDRENFDVHLRGFDPRVSVLREPGLKLGSSFSSLKKHPKFGKGTIFVFSCGSHDLLQSVSLEDCLIAMCPYPQTMLTLPPTTANDTQYLIKKALQVNIDILLATENDIALFCGVIPVRINHYNTYAVSSRNCLLHHSALQIPNVDLEKYTKYRETCTWFNNFTRYHAVTLSYTPWDMEQVFFSKDSQKNVLLPNCYNVTPTEEIRRANRAKILCSELLSPVSSNAMDAEPTLQSDKKEREQKDENTAVAISAMKMTLNATSLPHTEEKKSVAIPTLKTMANEKPIVAATPVPPQTTIVASLTSKNKVIENLIQKNEEKKILSTQVVEKKIALPPTTITSQATAVVPALKISENTSIIDGKLNNVAEDSKIKNIESTLQNSGNDLKPTTASIIIGNKYSDKRLENVKSIYYNNIKKINLLQNNRTPSNIVIVTDDRENLADKLTALEPRVEVLKIPDAKLNSIFPAIKKHPKFGKGTIYVLSCGSHDLLVSNPLADCKRYKCYNQQNMFTFPSYISNFHYLIKKALELHLNILRCTKNDIALFCGLLPVLINEFNKYNLSNRLCSERHPASLAPYIEHIHLSNYQFVLKWYNDFTKYHAQSLGFTPWDLEVTYFENTNQGNGILPDGYNICEDEQLNRANKIKLLCSELLNSVSTPKLIATSAIQSPLKAANKPEIEAVAPTQVTRLQKETSLLPKTKYNQVTIIADSRYLPFLEHLKKPKVLVLADQQLEIDNLKDYFEKKKANLTKKTLYLFIIGIHSVTKTVPFIPCKSNCKYILDALDSLDKGDFKTHVINLIKKLHSTMKILNPILPEDSDFAVLPPLPISVLNLNVLHQKIHESKSRFPNYFIVNRTFLISKLYQVWIDGILTLSVSSLAKCADLHPSVFKKFDDEFKKLKSMNCNINDKPSYEIWKEVSNVIVDAVLEKHAISNAMPISNIETETAHSPTMDKPEVMKSTVPYDYLVFIGHDTSFKLLPEIDFCSHSKWSFDDVIESKNLSTAIKHLAELSVKKILFIFISDVEMIGIKNKNPECMVKKCDHPFDYLVIQNAQSSIAKKIKDTVDVIKNIASDIKKLSSCQLKIVIAPFTPRTYILVSDMISFHSKMHEHLKCDTSACFLKGNLRKYFDDILIGFESEWKKLTLEVQETEEDKNIASDYAAKNISPITWKNLTSDPFSNISPVLSGWKACIVLLAKREWFGTSFTSTEEGLPDLFVKVDQPKKPSIDSLLKLNSNEKKENIADNTYLKQSILSVDTVTNLPAKVLPPSAPSTELIQPNISTKKETAEETDKSYMKPSVVNTDSINNQTKPTSYASELQTTVPSTLNSQATNMQPVIKSITMLPNKRLLPNIDQANYDHSEAILNRDLDDVMQFARTILRSADAVKSSDAMFKNIFFVGKQKLINPLLECNLKATMISHDFDSFGDSDIQNLLIKIGNFPEKSVCCLIFDVTVIASNLVPSAGCYKHSCKQPLLVSALKTKSTNISQAVVELDDLIYNKLQNITEYIVKLSRHVPVIVLPLVPTRIYCVNALSLQEQINPAISILNHQHSHVISDLGACVVCGPLDLWSQAVQSLNLSWSILMDMNNRSYDILNCVSAYIGCKPNNFPILNNISDFVVHWNEADIWKALIEAIMLPLVYENKKSINGNDYFTISDENFITVSTISPSIPLKFLEELFRIVDPNIFIVRLKDNCCTLKGVTIRNARLAEKLDSCRIGDTMLHVSIINNSGFDVIDMDLMENLYISSLFKKVYKKWKPQIISILAKEINEVPDVATLKSRPCDQQRICRGPKICPWHHSFYDKRRNPFIYKYVDSSCKKAKRGDGLCREGVQCRSSHNMWETNFHPVNYQVSPCLSGRTAEICNNFELCPYSHRDSPERFFIKEWDDLCVIGLHHSLKFFAGAIRAVIKVPNLSRTNLRVLLISPSSDFLEVAVSSASELIRNYALNSYNLGKNVGNPDSCQVLVGEPDAFINADSKIFMNMRGAIIVDDIQQILANEDQKNNLLQFLKLIKTQSFNIALNKVFVSATFDPKSTSSVSEFIGFPLKSLYVPEIDKSKDSLPLQSFNKRKRDDSTQKAVSGQNSPKRYRRSNSKSPPHFGRKRSRSRSSSRNEESDLRSADATLKRNRNDQNRLEESIISSSHKLQDTFEQSNISINSNNKEPVLPISGKNEPSELRNLFGSKHYKEYATQLNMMHSAFEEEYAVFKDVPELHPNYENYYQTFADDYITQHGYRDDQHKEIMWKMHWKNIYESIKIEDWELKQRDLIEENKGKVGNRCSSVFEEALTVLESVCDKVPYLGLAVREIITTCRNFGTTTKEAFGVFTDSEAVTLLNLTSEKLIAMSRSCTDDSRYQYDKAVNCIPKLLNEAKKGPLLPSMSIQDLPIDIKAIARVSTGKGADFALNLIRSALAYEGITNPSNEQVNDLFRKVCDLHV